jgi:type I restriction enzyme, S subunit
MAKKDGYFVPLMSGTANVSLKIQDIADVEIPLPPLEEQQRIVARIEELAARIEEARGLRREALEEVNGLLAIVLKDKRESMLYGNYPKAKLGDVTNVSAGGTPTREVATYWNGNLPWIKTGELLDGDIYRAEEYISDDGLNNSSAKLFPPETILIALYGQGQTRGRTGRLMITAATNQACCAILPSFSHLEPRFTQYWLRSLYSEMRESSHGGAQPNWNGQMIKNIEIALLPLPEQRRIVTYLDDLQARVDVLKQLQAETRAELDSLLPSILDKAFKGELV